MSDGRKPQPPRWLGIVTLAALALAGLFFLSPPKDVAPTSTSSEADAPPPVAYSGTTLDVTMSISDARLGPLTVSGKTNLPDGTVLSLLLHGDYPACSPRCGFELSQSAVQSGKFSAKINADRDPAPGMYTVDITTVSGLAQPPNIQALIGPNGEGLRGPLVAVLGDDGKYIPINPEQTSASQYLTGFLIHYTQRINIREDGSVGVCGIAGSSGDACGTSGVAETTNNPAGNAVAQTSGDTASGTRDQTSSNASGSQGVASVGASSDAIETVRRFYDALSSADGDAAASYVVPEKRQSGSLSGAGLTAAYSAFSTPLVLHEVWAGANGLIYAHYSYTASDGGKCLASSLVKLVERVGDLYIDEVRVNEKCQ